MHTLSLGGDRGDRPPPPWISTQSNVCWNDKKKAISLHFIIQNPSRTLQSIASEQEVCIAENQSEIKFVGFFDELK